MTSGYLDRYGRVQSLCHRLPAHIQFLLAVGMVVTGLSIPVELWPVQVFLICVVFAGHTLAHVPMSYLFRRLSLFLPMMLLLSISLPFSQGFERGWEMMVAILFRSTLAFLTMLWLVNVMPFDQLLITLRRFWVPEVLIALLSFMYRYIFVLWDELDKMRVARRARSFGQGRTIHQWKVSAQLIGMLLIRSMERAERVHSAMCARGWDGHVRKLDSTPNTDA
jgi:cobalt/nickel transport system permease protein